MTRPSTPRLAIGSLGVLMIGYGAFRILQFPKLSTPKSLAEWLIGAAVLHDGVLAPVVTVLGVLAARFIPGRARAYLQGFFIAAATVSITAWVLIHRENTGSPGNTLLIQDYTRNLLIVIGVLALGALLLYLLRVVRDRRAGSTPRPAAD